eukprot:7377232-Prymnesium_polylepis.1
MCLVPQTGSVDRGPTLSPRSLNLPATHATMVSAMASTQDTSLTHTHDGQQTIFACTWSSQVIMHVSE